jgi:hypothetical protein
MLTSAAIFSAAPANAAPEVDEKAAQEMARIASEMRYNGASDAQIQTRTGLKRVGTKATRTIRASMRSGPDEFTTLSTNSEVTVESSFYYDTTNKRYNAYVDFDWKGASLADGTWFGGDVGKLDGLAISFSKDVVQQYTPSMWAYWGGTMYTSSPLPAPAAPPSGISVEPGIWSNSAASAGFRYQDKVWSTNCGGGEVPTCARYNTDHGTLHYPFKKSTGCLQIFGAYGHTWDETSVTGLTLTRTGPELQFSKTDDAWQAATGAAKIDC